MFDVIKKRTVRIFREIFLPGNLASLYTVEGWFWTLEDVLVGERLKELLSLLLSQGSDLVPISWYYFEGDKRELTKEGIGKLVAKWQKRILKKPKERLAVYLRAKSRYSAWYWLELNHTDEYPFSAVHLHLDETYFRRSDHTASFLELLTQLYCLCKAEYLVCFHSLDLQKKYVRVSKHRKEVDRIATFWQKPGAHLPGLGWVTILGPRYVALTDPKIEAVNAFKKRMADGGVMFLTSSGPLEYGEKHVRKCEEDLMKVLPRRLLFDPSNPRELCLSPSYPDACRRWVNRDEFHMHVETHLYAPRKQVEEVTLVHRPTGLSVSTHVTGAENDAVERELVSQLRARVEKSQSASESAG